MIQYQLNCRPASIPPTQKRVTGRKGRLRIDIPINTLETTLVNFSKAAEAFAISLSDPLHRKFAYQYLGYLEDIARSSEQLRPNIGGRPDCRLIGAELERLFTCHFFRPEDLD